jgi:tetratricopeptide (TPR) repeat protein
MKRALVLLVLTLATAPAVAPAMAIDPFYQSLLREGVLAYDRGDYAASSRTLRIACFGMLDEPKALAGCLSRLALAQDRTDDAEGFQDTFRRLAEVEERFQAYAGAELPAETRAALEQRLVARIPVATLRSIPVFRPLADRKEAQSAQSIQSKPADPKPRRGQAETPPASSPSRVTAVPPQAAAPPRVPPQAVPAEPRAVTAAERDKMAQVRKLLGQNSKVKDLKQAYDLAREVADAHAESVEAQHLAAEAAYRLSRWADAARYFRRGGEPGENHPELQFYMAVSLFESGDAAGAAAILKRSLPNLQRSPYVDAYARKILG